MSGGRVLGYHFYGVGVNPKELGVGNIVWDYEAPTRNFPYQYGEDSGLVQEKDFFDPEEHSTLDVKFTEKKGFSTNIGIENIAWLGGHWGHEQRTQIILDKDHKAIEAHVLSPKLEEFEQFILRNPKTREWLHKQLSAAFTAGANCLRLFRRPKLWLCTGLITLNGGIYEVTYEGGKGVKVTLQDPTNTVPVGADIDVDTAPTSTRKMDIQGKTIIAAQWMLLYCRNIRRIDGLDTPYFVKLTATYAPNVVKGADSTLAGVFTSSSDIAEAVRRNMELSYESDEDDSDNEDQEEAGLVLFKPMFPYGDKEELEAFETALKMIANE